MTTELLEAPFEEQELLEQVQSFLGRTEEDLLQEVKRLLDDGIKAEKVMRQTLRDCYTMRAGLIDWNECYWEKRGKLSEKEQEQLADYEVTIEQGSLRTALALQEIHRHGLWREYGTIEAYALERWDRSRSWFFKLVKLAVLRKMLPGDTYLSLGDSDQLSRLQKQENASDKMMQALADADATAKANGRKKHNRHDLQPAVDKILGVNRAKDSTLPKKKSPAYAIPMPPRAGEEDQHEFPSTGTVPMPPRSDGDEERNSQPTGIVPQPDEQQEAEGGDAVDADGIPTDENLADEDDVEVTEHVLWEISVDHSQIKLLSQTTNLPEFFATTFADALDGVELTRSFTVKVRILEDG